MASKEPIVNYIFPLLVQFGVLVQEAAQAAHRAPQRPRTGGGRGVGVVLGEILCMWKVGEAAYMPAED